MLSITFLLAASSTLADKGNNSMGHAWLPTGLTMRMEQHKVQRIVSRVQVINLP
jgi:predicted nucleotide-binding protein (sugar kinase/HSP70/actin superfamily)